MIQLLFCFMCVRPHEGMFHAGVIEAWAAGSSWQDIMKDCSLDDGDVARLLTRTVDLLRHAHFCQGLLPGTRIAARKAMRAMDRNPIADLVQWSAYICNGHGIKSIAHQSHGSKPIVCSVAAASHVSLESTCRHVHCRSRQRKRGECSCSQSRE